METTPRTVYHLSPVRRGILIACWAVFAIPLLVGGVWSGDMALVATGGLCSLILLPIFAICGWWYPRLVVTSKNLVRHNVGYTLTVNWENVAELRLTKGFEGLVLHQPMEDSGAARFAIAASSRFGTGLILLYPPEVLDLIRARRFFPLESFAYWLKHGTLGEDIVRYAPGGILEQKPR